MKQLKKLLIVSTTLLFLFSCLSAEQISKYKKDEPEKGHIIKKVPFQKWKKRNYCGPAAMAMVLSYWKDNKQSQRKIAKEMHGFEEEIAYNSEMVLYPRTIGMMSYSFNGNIQKLKEIIKKDIPLIVLHKPVKQIDKGHYRVVIGFDEDSHQIIFHDPLLGERFAADYDMFNELWHWGEDINKRNWTLVVVPDEIEFDSLNIKSKYLTHINMATSYYRRQEYEKSLPIWELACSENESDPYPVYSLAMTHIRLDNKQKALEYAEKAVNMDKKNAFALDVLGLAYYKIGKLEDSLDILSQAMRLAPEAEFIRQHYLVVRNNYIDSHKKKEEESKR
jgi:tetratricopeptide (TPR) repeat protein